MAQPEYLALREIAPRRPGSASREEIPAFERSTRREQATRDKEQRARSAAPEYPLIVPIPQPRMFPVGPVVPDFEVVRFARRRIHHVANDTHLSRQRSWGVSAESL
jgi:hypothetical protein